MNKTWRMCILGSFILVSAAGVFAGDSWTSDGEGGFRINDIGYFEGVMNATPAEVIIHIGAAHSVQAHGSKRVLRHFQIDVRDGQLRIRNPWRPWFLLNFFRDREILIEVAVPELSSVKATGSGDVMVQDSVRGDALHLRTTGSGNVSANADVDELEISITGSGDIDIVGSTEELHAKLTGSGILVGSNLTADQADITISGSGDAVLAVQKKLYARLTGSGDLRLTEGSPEIEAKTTGSGKVVRDE